MPPAIEAGVVSDSSMFDVQIFFNLCISSSGKVGFKRLSNNKSNVGSKFILSELSDAYVVSNEEPKLILNPSSDFRSSKPNTLYLEVPSSNILIVKLT